MQAHVDTLAVAFLIVESLNYKEVVLVDHNRVGFGYGAVDTLKLTGKIWIRQLGDFILAWLR